MHDSNKRRELKVRIKLFLNEIQEINQLIQSKSDINKLTKKLSQLRVHDGSIKNQ